MESSANNLHRLKKLLLDTGEVSSIDELDRAFNKYGVQIVLGSSVNTSPAEQLIAATALNVAARTFDGNVSIELREDFKFELPGLEGISVSTFARQLGCGDALQITSSEWPSIVIGNSVPPPKNVSVEARASGWLFEVGSDLGSLFCDPPGMPLACVAAATVAVAEIFSFLRKDCAYAARRRIRMSLWNASWRDGDAVENAVGPIAYTVPTRLWLIGLGHLGQAYAWNLAFLRPEGDKDSLVVLQDIDEVTHSTPSTSVLSYTNDVGLKKTRVVSNWLESCGYNTRIVERRFDESMKVGGDEPRVALMGVDNAATRRVCERAGFRRVVDCGLGSTSQDFHFIRMRTFPGPRKASELWSQEAAQKEKGLSPAYEAMLRAGQEQCGVTMLASRAVGAPFVGCLAAAFVLAEIIRFENGGNSIAVLDLSIQSIDRREVAY